MKRSIFILFLLSLLGLFGVAYAQVAINSSDIQITMVPENPKPNETVVASAVSYITDINAAKITWAVNGKVISSGTGLKTFSFKTGGSGSLTTLTVTVVTKEGQTVVNAFKIEPVNIDLTWESQSYTPPFYKGKALFSYQNTIKFVATPHIPGSSGGEISPKNLIYTWTKDGTVDQDDSGFGKNTFTVTPSVIARPVDVLVEVSSPTTDATGLARIDVTPTDPTVLFYEKNPIYGIEFQKALTGTVDMANSKEISVIAEPYFFGTTDPNQLLSYKWEINGAAIDDDLSQMVRVFRPVDGTSGTSNISISLTHIKKILQLGTDNFNLEFENTQTNNTSL